MSLPTPDAYATLDDLVTDLESLETTGVEPAQSPDDGDRSTRPSGHDPDYAASIAAVLCHYARRREPSPELLSTLDQEGADVAELLGRGLVVGRPLSEPAIWQDFISALPEVWWLDLTFDLDITKALRQHLSADELTRLEESAATLIQMRDDGERAPAYHDIEGRFVALAEPSTQSDDHVDATRLLARGIAWIAALRADYPTMALDLVRADPSLELTRALTRDARLLDNPHWLSALLFRGDTKGRALAAATLLHAPKVALDRLRDAAALAPVGDLSRLAEAHGLVGLALDRTHPVMSLLRGALLVHVFCGERLEGLPWWKVFRGEQIIADSLDELGSSRDSLARDVLSGLPWRIESRGLKDLGVRNSLAACLADILCRDAAFSAPMRLAEAKIREFQRDRERERMADALRDYAHLLVATGKRLVEAGRRATADAVYTRVVRLRHEHPDVLMADLFPDRLERALTLLGASDAKSLGRRLRLESTSTVAGQGAAAHSGPRPTHADPFPGAHDIVAAVTGTEPLPVATAVWAGAIKWTPIRLLDALVPLPLRRLTSRLFRGLGSTPRARLLLSADGHGSLRVEQRLFGVPVYTEDVAVPAYRVFVFPNESPRADRLLGRWAALLVALSTIGTWLCLRAADSVGQIAGATVLGGALLAYMGALSLHRVVGSGLAMAVLDERGRATVWSLTPEDRALLVRYAERALEEPVAAIVRHDPDSPLPPAHSPATATETRGTRSV